MTIHNRPKNSNIEYFGIAYFTKTSKFLTAQEKDLIGIISIPVLTIEDHDF